LCLPLIRLFTESEMEIRRNWLVKFFSLERSPNSILDIDGKSLQFARQNVQANNLHERIKLLQTKSDGPLLPLDIMGFEQ
jgi:hypothetical protein